MPRPGSAARVLPAGPLDAPILAAIQNAAFPAQPWSQADVATLMQGPEAIALLAVGRAYGEEMPLGYVLARVAADEAEILSIGVLEEARGHGLGGHLLAAALERARALGATRVHLEVAADNPAAAALYRKAGFALVGRRAGYYTRYNAPAVDADVLSRNL